MRTLWIAALLMGTAGAVAQDQAPHLQTGKVGFASGLFCNTPSQVVAVIGFAAKQEGNGDKQTVLRRAIREINRAEGPSCFYIDMPLIASTYVEQISSTNAGGLTYQIHKVLIVGTYRDDPCTTEGNAEPACEPNVTVQAFTQPKEQYVFTSPLHNFAGAQAI